MPNRLVLLSSSQSLGSTTQSVSVVSSELGVNVSQRSVSVGLWLLDTVLVSLLGLVVVGVVLRLRHFALNVSSGQGKKKGLDEK